jgi:hypothetical protein
MHRSGDEFLARTGLPLNEHSRLGGRHLLYFAQQLPHRRALADDFFEVMFGFDLLLEVKRVGLESRF